ncbi:ROK family protein [Thermoleophilia bacterium SCSIO 60948]|nr:ROK family protein [Thermoleophilia bacterium SCSIO 60948]
MTVAIGADLGGTKMLVGALDSERSELHRSTKPSGGHTQDELIETIATSLEAAIEEVPEAEAVGLGIPCTLDWERGIAIQAVNLPLKDVPIRDLLSERLGLPVLIDNDANVAALAEHRFGAARGSDVAVILTLGTGIGGGLIVGGEVFRGSSGGGAELGHVIVDLDGPPCQGACRSRGCIETFASGTAIARDGLAAAERERSGALGEILEAGGEIDGKAVIEAALGGDEIAAAVVAEAGRKLGAALTSLANVFEPGLFAVGGGVMAAGDLVLEPARRELRERALPPQDETPVVPAELGPDAGMVGAALMALEHLEAEAS